MGKAIRYTNGTLERSVEISLINEEPEVLVEINYDGSESGYYFQDVEQLEDFIQELARLKIQMKELKKKK